MSLHETIAEARRNMEICNACRYCEGFCAVFPAMELRRSFTDGDLEYLANLCHDCRGCYYACQYAPPHAFGVNVPQSLSRLRRLTYEKYAWPAPLAGLLQRNGLVVALAMALGVAFVLLATALFQDPEVLFGRHRGAGAFYAVIPYGLMVGVPLALSAFVLLAFAIGFARFWRETGGEPAAFARPRPLGRALCDVLTLRYLGGDGEGCNDRDDTFSNRRRWFHQTMFYGFMLCFAATCVATLYDHGLGVQAPYGYTSLPVVLGTTGGIGLLVGTTGLFWVKLQADPAPSGRQLLGMDVAFLALLWLTALTGLVLLVLRETAAMGVVLAVHLGFVLAFFAMLPYSKFVHAIYRLAALIRYAIEKRVESSR